MLILDIGCGRKKIAGAVGIDFSQMCNADVVLDLNHGRLPYDDNSVDFIFSSHTLEHLILDGFVHVMRESYRVLRAGSQFKIVVPYYPSTANFANLLHNNNICFNEHTFRFFSSETEREAISKDEYQSPSCQHWGLRYSSNNEIGIEFITLRIDKFYLPLYSEQSEPVKAACSSKLNVAVKISNSLQAIKLCPIRPSAGPVSSPSDSHIFVERQLSFLSKQLTYLNDLGFTFEPEIERGRQLCTSQRVAGGGLYSTGFVLTPVNFLVHELDYVIQALRRLIDNQSNR
ncbi:class I SAM-dependent methyltransferase [Endozoicomonas sp. 8E]|uniref:class I SAM-dependent methyltransferase n=1 Tax=Endozoicomonas sp. 8E TaxID=3035692 RepID=UPI002938F225|nr:class I SAM-dependent methyltransferase [Endozoicomonas sp. 8E]WOG26345.1 class I SAM-dependent methyltransferase [Endozoicomonas sp. 8E]